MSVRRPVRCRANGDPEAVDARRVTNALPGNRAEQVVEVGAGKGLAVSEYLEPPHQILGVVEKSPAGPLDVGVEHHSTVLDDAHRGAEQVGAGERVSLSKAWHLAAVLRHREAEPMWIEDSACELGVVRGTACPLDDEAGHEVSGIGVVEPPPGREQGLPVEHELDQLPWGQ